MRSKDPREGITLPDPKEVARKVKRRRIKRKLKAAVSLAIAAAAGTFVACKGGDDQRPNPDAGVDAAVDAAPADASADAALVPVDAASKKGKVDREEHRKGMPVPDNLLE